MPEQTRHATFRFYEELNDFLPAERRKLSFEFAFAGTPSGTGTDLVVFADGDATSPVAAPLPTLSDALGTAAPFLDVSYEIPVAAEDEGQRRLAGFMLRRQADRVAAAHRSGRSTVLFHFDH